MKKKVILLLCFVFFLSCEKKDSSDSEIIEYEWTTKQFVFDHDGNSLFKYDAKGDKSPYQIEHDKLFESIRNGAIINNTEYGAMSTLTSIMGRMATYSGKLITREQALNSTDILVPDNLNWEINPPVMPDNNGKYPVAIPGVFKIS